MKHVFWTVAGLLVVVGLALLVRANSYCYRMIDEVNAEAGQESEKISWMFVNFKLDEIKRRHASLYPGSKIPLRMDILSLLGVVSLLASLVVLAFSTRLTG